MGDGATQSAVDSPLTHLYLEEPFVGRRDPAAREKLPNQKLRALLGRLLCFGHQQGLCTLKLGADSTGFGVLSSLSWGAWHVKSGDLFLSPSTPSVDDATGEILIHQVKISEYDDTFCW